jgi:hypothetical protein
MPATSSAGSVALPPAFSASTASSVELTTISAKESDMGIRMDQFAGLAPEALKFLDENRRPPCTCPACGHVTAAYIEAIDEYTGMFGDSYPLHRYQLKHGKTADEFLQVADWSSGAVHFLGLRLEDGTEITWGNWERAEWL